MDKIRQVVAEIFNCRSLIFLAEPPSHWMGLRYVTEQIITQYGLIFKMHLRHLGCGKILDANFFSPCIFNFNGQLYYTKLIALFIFWCHLHLLRYSNFHILQSSFVGCLLPLEWLFFFHWSGWWDILLFIFWGFVLV